MIGTFVVCLATVVDASVLLEMAVDFSDGDGNVAVVACDAGCKEIVGV